MTRDEVLQELDLLATVEHALIVEYLTVQCALGHDLEAGEGGAKTPELRSAADTAFNLAFGEMIRFKNVSRALVKAGRFAPLQRAPSIENASHVQIPLDPPSKAQLERLHERETEIAAAVDWHYSQLSAGVPSDGAFEGADRLRPIIEDGTTHVAALAPLWEALGDPVPPDILRATGRVARDAFEERLLRLSDRTYRVVVGVLNERFAADSSIPATLPTDTMDALDDANRVLVQRGLLPPFS